MIKRIVEISRPSYLFIKFGQLCIQQHKVIVGKIPPEDLGILLLAHPAVTLTQAVLELASSNNTAIIVCDRKYQPTSLVSPLVGHSTHAKILKEQIAYTLPKQKSAWTQIIQAKISGQAANLRQINGEYQYLTKLAGLIKSGDPDNKEAQGARYYWQRYLGKDFRRDPDSDGINILLNYGYAVIRAAVARAVVAAGLHPALGIYHRNLYNAFALADDLMEPLRPKVDRLVRELGHNRQLDTTARTAFLALLSAPAVINNQNMPLMVALHHYLASFKNYMTGEVKTIAIPH